MDKNDIVLKFKELARKNLLSQEEKYGRKQKYKGQYCCSDQEVDTFIKVFQKILDEPENMDYDSFLTLFEERGG